MSSFRPFQILSQIAKRQGSAFSSARNFCKGRCAEKVPNLPETKCIENSHVPKTSPQYPSPPEPANTRWWPFWGGGTKTKLSHQISPPQQNTSIKSDAPDIVVPVHSNSLFTYATTWVSFLNKFGFQRVERVNQVGEVKEGAEVREAEQDMINHPILEQFFCDTRADGADRCTPYVGEDPRILQRDNHDVGLARDDLGASQQCNKHDRQTRQLAAPDPRGEINIQDSPPELHSRQECNGSRLPTQGTYYRVTQTSGVPVKGGLFRKDTRLGHGVSSRSYSTSKGTTRPDHLEPLPVENKPQTVGIEKPAMDLASMYPPVSELQSSTPVLDNLPSIICLPAGAPISPPSMGLSPLNTNHVTPLPDQTLGTDIALETPLTTTVPATANSGVLMPGAKDPTSNVLGTTAFSDTQSPLARANKEDPLHSSQMPPTESLTTKVEEENRKTTNAAFHRCKETSPNTNSTRPPLSQLSPTTKAKNKTPPMKCTQPAHKSFSPTTRAKEKTPSMDSTKPHHKKMPPTTRAKGKNPSMERTRPPHKQFSPTRPTRAREKTPSMDRTRQSHKKSPAARAREKTPSMGSTRPPHKSFSPTTKSKEKKTSVHSTHPSHNKISPTTRLKEKPPSMVGTRPPHKAFSTTTKSKEKTPSMHSTHPSHNKISPTTRLKEKPPSIGSTQPPHKKMSPTAIAKEKIPSLVGTRPSHNSFSTTTKSKEKTPPMHSTHPSHNKISPTTRLKEKPPAIDSTQPPHKSFSPPTSRAKKKTPFMDSKQPTHNSFSSTIGTTKVTDKMPSMESTQPPHNSFSPTIGTTKVTDKMPSMESTQPPHNSFSPTIGTTKVTDKMATMDSTQPPHNSFSPTTGTTKVTDKMATMDSTQPPHNSFSPTIGTTKVTDKMATMDSTQPPHNSFSPTIGTTKVTDKMATMDSTQPPHNSFSPTTGTTKVTDKMATMDSTQPPHNSFSPTTGRPTTKVTDKMATIDSARPSHNSFLSTITRAREKIPSMDNTQPSSATETFNDTKIVTDIRPKTPTASKVFSSITKATFSEVKKNLPAPVMVPSSKAFSSTTKTLHSRNHIVPKFETSISSSKAFSSMTKAPLDEAKKTPPILQPTSKLVKVHAAKAFSSSVSTTKPLDDISKKALLENKKPCSNPVKLQACKKFSSITKPLVNAKTRTATRSKLQKSSLSKNVSSLIKEKLLEIDRKPLSTPVNLPPRKKFSSITKPFDDAKTGSKKCSSIKVPLLEINKKLLSNAVKLQARKHFSSITKPFDDAKIGSKNFSFPIKVPLLEINRKPLSNAVKLQASKKCLSTMQTLDSTNNRRRKVSRASTLTTITETTMDKTKDISASSKALKHLPGLDNENRAQPSFAHTMPTSKEFASRTKAPLSQPNRANRTFDLLTLRSQRLYSTAKTGSSNLKHLPPTSTKMTPVTKSFSSITNTPTLKTKASYSVIHNTPTVYSLPNVKNASHFASPMNSEPTAEMSCIIKDVFFNSSKIKPPLISDSGAFHSASATRAENPNLSQCPEEKQDEEHQAHCRRKKGECSTPLFDNEARPKPQIPDRKSGPCPAKVKVVYPSCKGMTLPGCRVPESISCERPIARSTSRKKKKREPPFPSFSECVRDMPRPPKPTECCLKNRHRYLQPAEPMLFPRLSAISPPVVEPYIDPCKGMCCQQAVEAASGDPESLFNQRKKKTDEHAAAKAEVLECLFQDRKFILPGCRRPKSTICVTELAPRTSCNKPLAPVPSFSESYTTPFPKRPLSECRVAKLRAELVNEALARGIRLTMEALFAARCKIPGFKMSCNHQVDDSCPPTTPRLKCAKEPPKSMPNRLAQRK